MEYVFVFPGDIGYKLCACKNANRDGPFPAWAGRVIRGRNRPGINFTAARFSAAAATQGARRQPAFP